MRCAHPPLDSSYRVRKVSDLTVALYHSNRGVALMLEGQHVRAALRLRRAAALDPSLAAVRINLGVTLRRLGDLEGAEAAYRDALSIDPHASGARRGLVALLRSQGRSDEIAALLAADGRRGLSPEAAPR